MATRKTSTKGSARKKAATKTRGTAKKWSGEVTRNSNALDLESKVFKLGDPKKIARSLKRSAARSKRRKGTPFQSAMSMLNFYINRGGKNLSGRQKKILEQSKDELRKVFKRRYEDSLT
jgi:hypothetical protein